MAAEMIVDMVKSFPGRPTIRASFRYPVESSTVLILFGPSGSGKTTVLRSLAGLEWPEDGHIRFLSNTWLDTTADIRVAPQKRRIGYMSQHFALFPTYTVAGNIGFGLGELSMVHRMKRVEEMLELFQLKEYADAKPQELSGGQQQRVALARAVAPRPQLLLLDEPFSALDAPNRHRLRGGLRSLLSTLRIPSVIVTHDWTEALMLGDTMAIMNDGNVVQVGAPQEVFSRPANAEVAKVVGIETVVEGKIIDSSYGLVTIEVGHQILTGLGEVDIGPDVFVCIRAEDVVLEPPGTAGTSARNHLQAIVQEIDMTGPLAKVSLDCGFPLTALVTRPALEELGLGIRSSVRAAIKAGSVHLVPRSHISHS